MKKTNKIIIGVVLVVIMLLGIGYAAIQNITLNIGGTSTADPNQSNFKVKFSGTPTTSDASKVVATITDDINATVNVQGLTAKGDKVTAEYIVQNISVDLSANLTVEASNSNKEYFIIEAKTEKTSLSAGDTTKVLVTVELIKTPIVDNESTTIGLKLIAKPVQPGQESENISSEGEMVGLWTITPYIPSGFGQVETTNADDGFTIQDSNENKYVWIEVPKTENVYKTAGLKISEFTEEEYALIENDLITYTSKYKKEGFTDTWTSEEATGLIETEYYVLKNKMIKSIYQNGGFYVGKYETGTLTERTSGSSTTAPTETPVIKQNAYPYNFVTCSQAQVLAGRMESGNYTTSLMFGLQWNLVLKYLETSGVSFEELNTDSTSWGNYLDNTSNITNENSKYTVNGLNWTNGAYGQKNNNKNVLLSTGASDDFCKLGIYDLAGNVWEWTLESYAYNVYRPYPCSAIGGFYGNTGSALPAGVHSYFGTSDAANLIGFRVSIY